MSERDIIYRILPPAMILTTVERQPEEYPYPPDVYIREVERRELAGVEINYDELNITIGSCTVEIVHGETEYGQCFRAFRIVAINDMRAMEYADNCYPIFLIPDNTIRGTLTVDDGQSWWRYVIDKWYDDDETRDHDIEYDDPPDLVPALALLFRPHVRDLDM